MPCRTESIPVLYPLDDTSIPQDVAPEMSSDIADVLWESGSRETGLEKHSKMDRQC